MSNEINELKTEQWWNNIMDIAGSIKLTDDSYKDMGEITIPMKNGHVQFDKLKKMLLDGNLAQQFECKKI